MSEPEQLLEPSQLGAVAIQGAAVSDPGAPCVLKFVGLCSGGQPRLPLSPEGPAAISPHYWSGRKEVEKRENRLSEYCRGALPNHILGFVSILNAPVAAKAGKL